MLPRALIAYVALLNPTIRVILLFHHTCTSPAPYTFKPACTVIGTVLCDTSSQNGILNGYPSAWAEHLNILNLCPGPKVYSVLPQYTQPILILFMFLSNMIFNDDKYTNITMNIKNN